MTRGKRIVPRRALDLGFHFDYPTLEAALSDLVPEIVLVEMDYHK